MRFAGALLLLSLLAACRTAPAPSQPRVERVRARAPAELFPEDLDLVVRIDAARVRQNPMLAGVVSQLATVSPSEMLASVKTAFGDAAALWVGTRWMSDGFHGDGVLAIEGAAGGDTRVAAPSDKAGRDGSATDGARRRVAVPWPDVEVFERPASSRGEAALEVLLPRGVVLATASESDAVLRVLRSAPDEARLDPPARGLLSFAGRPRGGAPFGAPATTGTIAGLAEALIGYAGVLEDEETEAIDVEVFLAYASAGDATRAESRVRQAAQRLAVAGGAVGTASSSVKLTAMGTSLRVQVAVPFALLAGLH